MRFRDEQPLTVAGLNRAVRLGLESEWGNVWVVGEISDVTRSGAGHVYFTLNDELEMAQVRVVMFKSDARRTRAALEVGARVRVHGGLTLYEARGTFQLLARGAVPAGEGDLAAQFRKLVQKLDAEGLFDKEKKRPLPRLPRCVGLVTSDHGAAVHDVIQVASERCPVRIVISPCLVQGAEAPASIVRALALVQKLPDLDVVIVTRGGGAAEDLWAFNDERVARAIAACRVPVVSGIGHEVDTTIADLVADVRAATPSNAAELVVPERAVLDEQLRALERALERAMASRVDRGQLSLSRALAKLKDPRKTLGRCHDVLDAQLARLVRSSTARLAAARAELERLEQRLEVHDPRARLASQRERLVRAQTRLELSPERFLRPREHALARALVALRHEARTQLSLRSHRLRALAGRLEALSPLAVLSRGYAIAFSVRTGEALRSAADAKTGDLLRVRLGLGELSAQVTDRE